MVKFEIDTEGTVVFSDGTIGAILLDDEMWYPFRYFGKGEYDIWDNDGGYIKPSTAYKMAKLKFA